MLTTQSPWKNPSRNCYLINTQKPKGKPADKKKKAAQHNEFIK